VNSLPVDEYVETVCFELGRILDRILLGDSTLTLSEEMVEFPSAWVRRWCVRDEDGVLMFHTASRPSAVRFGEAFARRNPGTRLDDTFLAGEPTEVDALVVAPSTASSRDVTPAAAPHGEMASPAEEFSIRVPQLRLVKGDAA
jgi:hypothetical protein